MELFYILFEMQAIITNAYITEGISISCSSHAFLLTSQMKSGERFFFNYTVLANFH
jgi:hypothetical protein